MAVSRGLHGRGRRDHDGHAHDRGRANGRCHDLRGPSVLRAIPTLAGSGRNGDASSMLLQTEDAPNVRAPTCNDDPPVPNIPQSKRTQPREAARVLHRQPLAGAPRCTPKFAPNSERRLRLRAVRQTSSSISFLGLLLGPHSPMLRRVHRGVNEMSSAARTLRYMA